MAASTQKKTTKKNTGTSSRSKKPAQPQQRPIRREVTGGILLVLALCVCVGYFGTSGLFIDWLAVSPPSLSSGPSAGR